MNKIAMSFAAIVALAFFHVSATPAQGQPYYQAGTLTCRLAPSIGLVVGSRQRMDCRFSPRHGGSQERYAGSVTRLGLDIGFSAGGVMTWAVFTKSSRIKRGVLAGNFVGASGDVAFGLGVGANVLVGGSRRSVMLQPVSVSGQVGFNLAAGVAGLRLRYQG